MEYSRETSALVARVAENISRMTPGTVLLHIQLSEQLEVNYKKEMSKYHARMSSVKGILKNQYQIFLEPLYRSGYQILQPGEEIRVCENRVGRGVKQIVRGVRDTAQIPIDRIADPEKKTLTIQKAQKLGNLLGLLKAGGALPENRKKIEG